MNRFRSCLHSVLAIFSLMAIYVDPALAMTINVYDMSKASGSYATAPKVYRLSVVQQNAYDSSQEKGAYYVVHKKSVTPAEVKPPLHRSSEFIRQTLKQGDADHSSTAPPEKMSKKREVSGKHKSEGAVANPLQGNSNTQCTGLLHQQNSIFELDEAVPAEFIAERKTQEDPGNYYLTSLAGSPYKDKREFLPNPPVAFYEALWVLSRDFGIRQHQSEGFPLKDIQAAIQQYKSQWQQPLYDLIFGIDCRWSIKAIMEPVSPGNYIIIGFELFFAGHNPLAIPGEAGGPLHLFIQADIDDEKPPQLLQNVERVQLSQDTRTQGYPLPPHNRDNYENVYDNVRLKSTRAKVSDDATDETEDNTYVDIDPRPFSHHDKNSSFDGDPAATTY